MARRKGGGARKSYGSASAWRTSTHRPKDIRRGDSAEEVIKAAMFWTLGLLRKRSYGKYSNRDVANVLALAATSKTSTSRVC